MYNQPLINEMRELLTAYLAGGHIKMQSATKGFIHEELRKIHSWFDSNHFQAEEVAIECFAIARLEKQMNIYVFL